MISNSQIQLNIVAAYIAFLEANYADSYERTGLLRTIEIYQWHLRLKHRQIPPKVEHLETLKNGVRNARHLFHHLQGAWVHITVTDWIDLVAAMVVELNEEIQEREIQYPEMKDTFDRERQQYRSMEQAAWKALEKD